MASLAPEHAGEAGDQPAMVQELGFTMAEIETLLDAVLGRDGWSFAKERALPYSLSYRIHSAADGDEVLLHFEPLPDRTFAGGHIRLPRTRFTCLFQHASAKCIEDWQRRLQRTFLKGGG